MATQIIKTRFKIRNGTAAEWESVNPILLEGEPGYATDTNVYKIGNGKLRWTELPPISATESSVVDIKLIYGGDSNGNINYQYDNSIT